MNGLGGHAFNSVSIPIKSKNGNLSEVNYLIDATYRQFFLRDGFSVSGRFVNDKRFGNKVAPFAGYWCINLPGGTKFAKNILRNGFVELTPENAKIYGDSFILEEQKNKEYTAKYEEGVTIPQSTTKDVNTAISGEQYISWFTDETRQDYRGIDFNDGELEEYYGDLMKTPLMMKEKFQQKSNNATQQFSEKEIDKRSNEVYIEDEIK